MYFDQLFNAIYDEDVTVALGAFSQLDQITSTHPVVFGEKVLHRDLIVQVSRDHIWPLNHQLTGTIMPLDDSAVRGNKTSLDTWQKEAA